ncbi:MAG: sugar ABC transporter permease [Firmicutes bacterium]|nr:sugar ABC transporter permease [Bacillota bacterium]
MKSNANVSIFTSGVKYQLKRDWNLIIFKSIFLLPALAFLVIFMYYPIEETFRLSMMRATGLGDTVFIGFDNYLRLFKNDEFIAGFINVFAWSFWSVIIQIPLAFFIAFSLSVYKNKITSPLRAVYYLANILPSAITAMLGRFIFAPRYGVIATISEKFNWTWLGKIDFLGDTNIVFWSIFTVATWAYTGFGIIYLMANIEQIPMELREAAELDGANKWQYARFIVLPMIAYPIRILAIISTIGSLKLFDLPWMLTGGGPGYSTSTLVIALYKQGFVNWQYGRGSAIGVIIFLLALIFAVTQFSLQGKEGSVK